MPRMIPDCPQKPNPPPEATRSLDIELITPLFGGGVETRKNDPTFPIRPTAIRGQLQFWWRATVGGRYPSREELRRAQSEIWGSTERASRVEVRVDSLQVEEPSPCALFEQDRSRLGRYRSTATWESPFRGTSLPYALFPFQGQLANGGRQIEVEPACCITRPKFRLTLTLRDKKDLWPEVEPAVWAWINFGGLGSRTRRGCGALYCKELAPGTPEQFKEHLSRYAPGQDALREWPTLADSILIRTGERPGDPIHVWDWLIACYKYFRQGKKFARHPRTPQGSPGRSYYPEPEAIRRVTGRRLRKHPRLDHIPDDAFPRAEFGLPIVFSFKDEDKGEPQKTSLYPGPDEAGNKRERMASPLILKPLALANGKAVPLILRLKAPHLTGVDLREGNTSLHLPATTALRDPRLSAYPNSPLAGSPGGSALEAFLAFARTEGFTEVTP